MKPIYRFDIVQGTPDWNAIRLGKMTGSHAQCIQAQGKGLDTYILELVAERLTGLSDSGYTNEAMQRGHEQEVEAREIWALENGVHVQEVGFVECDEYVGCSPDGLIDDAVLEIKSHNNKVFTELLLTEKINTGYVWQAKMNAILCERPNAIYIGYNPNFKNPFFVREIPIDDESRDKILSGLEYGRKKIDEYCNKLAEQRKDITIE